MKAMMKSIIVAMVTIIIFLGFTNCSPSISQEEYDSVQNELSDVRLQVEALQDKLDEAMIIEEQHAQLNTQYQELEKQYDAQTGEIQTLKSDLDELNVSYEELMLQDEARIDEIQAMSAEYDKLNQEFKELKREYDALVQGAVFSEEEVNQAIFALVNQERTNNGLAEIEWGVNLYGWAKQNSQAMAEKGEYEYSSWTSYQALLITAGHSTLEGLTNSAFLVWKQRKYEYSRIFLNTIIHYGAVATYRSGDVYYITFMASPSP